MFFLLQKSRKPSFRPMGGVRNGTWSSMELVGLSIFIVGSIMGIKFASEQQLQHFGHHH